MDQQNLCHQCQTQINNLEGYCYCEMCLKKLNEQADQEEKELQQEILELENQIERVKQEVIKMEDNKNRVLIEKVQEERRVLEQEVQKLEEEEIKQQNDLNKLKSQIMDLEKNEESLWDHINRFTKKLYQLFENNSIADNQLNQLNNELERLSKLDIVNELFKISVQEDVGCINNLAIGKKGDLAIDWDDINAGVGHLSLLLYYLMKKYKYPFMKIESLELNGSNTRIIIRDSEKDQARPLNMYIVNRNSVKEEDEFNDALVALYVEFGYFCKYLTEGDMLIKRKIQLNLPYKMNGQMIADKSLNLKHYSSQKWQNWSDAIKKFLTNVKALIVMNAQFDLSL